MLSKINLGLNVLLLAAVAFLLSKNFQSTDSSNTAVSALDTLASFEPTFLSGNSRIVFVNADSLNQNYNFISEKYEELEREQLKIEGQVQQKMQKAEDRYKQLESQAANMTPAQLEQAQLELQSIQMEITRFQENLTADFRRKEAETQETFYKNIRAYLQDYNKESRYDYILTYQLGGQILLAHDSLDITEDVIKGLNASYQSSKVKVVK